MARNNGGRIPWMIPGIGFGAVLIQQSQLCEVTQSHVRRKLEMATYWTFSHSAEMLLSVPTNATGRNQRTISPRLPIQDVIYRNRVS